MLGKIKSLIFLLVFFLEASGCGSKASQPASDLPTRSPAGMDAKIPETPNEEKEGANTDDASPQEICALLDNPRVVRPPPHEIYKWDVSRDY